MIDYMQLMQLLQTMNQSGASQGNVINRAPDPSQQPTPGMGAWGGVGGGSSNLQSWVDQQGSGWTVQRDPSSRDPAPLKTTPIAQAVYGGKEGHSKGAKQLDQGMDWAMRAAQAASSLAPAASSAASVGSVAGQVAGQALPGVIGASAAPAIQAGVSAGAGAASSAASAVPGIGTAVAAAVAAYGGYQAAKAAKARGKANTADQAWEGYRAMWQQNPIGKLYSKGYGMIGDAIGI